MRGWCCTRGSFPAHALAWRDHPGPLRGGGDRHAAARSHSALAPAQLRGQWAVMCPGPVGTRWADVRTGTGSLSCSHRVPAGWGGRGICHSSRLGVGLGTAAGWPAWPLAPTAQVWERAMECWPREAKPLPRGWAPSAAAGGKPCHVQSLPRKHRQLFGWDLCPLDARCGMSLISLPGDQRQTQGRIPPEATAAGARHLQQGRRWVAGAHPCSHWWGAQVGLVRGRAQGAVGQLTPPLGSTGVPPPAHHCRDTPRGGISRGNRWRRRNC